jgi:hypothetical protein
MTGKRKIEQVDDASARPVLTAEEAELIRDKLLATHKSQSKNCRIYKRPTIDLSTINSTLNLVGFFKLDRELRDQIYQMFWSGTPQIMQRYKPCSYQVTYGDVPLETGPRTRYDGPQPIKHKVCDQLLRSLRYDVIIEH